MEFSFDPKNLFALLRQEFGPLTQRQVEAINWVLAGGPGVLPFRVDVESFFAEVRGRFGSLKQPQVDGFIAILDEWVLRKLTDRRWLAYMLATAWHETGTQMQPVIETQTARDKKRPRVETAIARLESSWAAGKMPWVKTPYWRKDSSGKSWLGRGLPQTTHKANYQKLSSVMGVDFVDNPDLMLEMEHAVPVMFEGMTRGIYTGRKLADYFDDNTDDPRQARRIINALESADKVKSYYDKFLAALKESAL